MGHNAEDFIGNTERGATLGVGVIGVADKIH
jgi:hypothetical protein